DFFFFLNNMFLADQWRQTYGKHEVHPFFSCFFFAQPSLMICRALPIASESGGTSSVMHEAAAIYDPFPIRIGATRIESLPTKTPSSIVVLWLLLPASFQVVVPAPTFSRAPISASPR